MYVDEASSKGFGGIGIVLKGSNGVSIEYALKLFFIAINNVIKYKVLVKGYDLAKKIEHKKLNVYNDS